MVTREKRDRITAIAGDSVSLKGERDIGFKCGSLTRDPWGITCMLFRSSFHHNLITCILCTMLGELLCHFFFTHFLEIRTVTCVLTIRSDDLTLWQKKAYGKRFLRSRRRLKNWGSCRKAVKSHRHFDLPCQQADCFYFWSLPFSRTLRTGYGASVYCNTFLLGSKASEMPIFSPYWTTLSNNAISFITALRCFDFHI